MSLYPLPTQGLTSGDSNNIERAKEGQSGSGYGLRVGSKVMFWAVVEISLILILDSHASHTVFPDFHILSWIRSGCLRFTKFCWVGKHMKNTIYETDELPNPRPTQPKEKQVKGGIWATFSPRQNIFSWVGIDFMQEADYKKPDPTKLSANTLVLQWLIGLQVDRL